MKGVWTKIILFIKKLSILCVKVIYFCQTSAGRSFNFPIFVSRSRRILISTLFLPVNLKLRHLKNVWKMIFRWRRSWWKRHNHWIFHQSSEFRSFFCELWWKQQFCLNKQLIVSCCFKRSFSICKFCFEPLLQIKFINILNY